MHLMPLLLSLVLILLLGLIVWGILRARRPEDGGGLVGTRMTYSGGYYCSLVLLP